MSRSFRVFLVAAPVVAAGLAAPAHAAVRAVPVVTGLASPVGIAAPAGDHDRLFVVEQGGRVRLVRNGQLFGAPFLDLSGTVSTGGERGLLGLAFHPDYARNGRFFVNYTNPQGNTVVAEYRVSSNPDLADRTTARVFLTQTQPFANHNGGHLAFSPVDGYLYVGLGDGGSGGDPGNRAQDDSTWLGKMLRIDVDGAAPGKAYGVPGDNPFASTPSGIPLPEIWAKGLRNPWRYAFDRRTFDLFIGDVGQGAWEEVDWQPAGARGGANYGWRLMEGFHCFNPATGCNPASALTLPLLEYAHGGSPSRCSITGGVVVRSPRVPEWAGRYLFADYCSGEVFSVALSGGVAFDARNDTAELAGGSGRSLGAVTSFGEDARGDVFFVSGSVLYRLDTDAPSATRLVPIVLDAPGKGGARYATELTLLNAGTSTGTARLAYTPAPALGATGGGAVSQSLEPGAQLTIPDAIAYLRSKGLAIPAGDAAQGGTLRVAVSGISSSPAAFALARTTTAAGGGRAGLAYGAPRAGELMTERAYLFGLRETAQDRTNLALANGGVAGTVTLRVTLLSGSLTRVLPDVTLAPGEWRQLDSVLGAAGMTNAFALVERVAGVAPFFAYAVFNDNVTNDGSFVPPAITVRPAEPQIVPAVVETTAFESEVVLANPAGSAVVATLTYVESLSASAGVRYTTAERLEAREQRIIPGFVDFLRLRGAGFGARGGSYSGTLTVEFRDAASGLPRWGFAGARTASPAEGGGAYGLFTPAVGLSETAFRQAWLPGLRQDDAVRTNLALAHAELDGEPISLSVELHDAATGLLIATVGPVTLAPGRWAQLDRVLRPYGLRAAYARVVRVSGNGRFLAYAVVNDGAAPGDGTGDGSVVAMENAE